MSRLNPSQTCPGHEGKVSVKRIETKPIHILEQQLSPSLLKTCHSLSFICYQINLR